MKHTTLTTCDNEHFIVIDKKQNGVTVSRELYVNEEVLTGAMRDMLELEWDPCEGEHEFEGYPGNLYRLFVKTIR